MRNILLFIGGVLLLPQWSNAQNTEGMKTRFEAVLAGEMLIIGNNILNRVQNKKDANTPHDTAVPLNNDSADMQYIDVDEDPETFSSSSATLHSEYVHNPKVVWAGLYWAGTYPFAKAEVSAGKVNVLDEKRENFTKILLKTPRQKKYTPIEGKVIFDAKDLKNYSENKPYVAFANVTSILQNNKKIDGEYTVANIPATLGTLPTGSCAGWALVVIYESPSVPSQKIEIKDGFLPISQKENNVDFKHLRTSEEENFPNVIIAALDADLGKGKNRLTVRSEKTGIYMETDVRSVDYFFNSSITQGENLLKERNPNSNNTLGFDVLSAEIPNFENQIIPAGSTSLSIGASSENNTFYIFLIGLSIAMQ